MLNQTVNFVTITRELLKGGSETDFVFEVKAERSEMESLNVSQVIDSIKKRGGQILFKSVENSLFRNNLMMVDGLIPDILAEVLLLSLSNNCLNLPTIIELLDKNNPLDFPQVPRVSYYKYKLKDLLRHLALGMNASEVWMGEPNVYEHYPVLKDSKQIIYYTDNIDSFLEILLQRAYIEKPKITIYNNNNKLFIKVNLEIGLTA